jgi:N-succinyl-L-ornithine transcarbamylase
MKKFISVSDVTDVKALVEAAQDLKKDPFSFQNLGKNKTIGLVFLNPSLRTRMSTQKAAMNLGMNVMALNAGQDSWAIEFQDGAVMNGTKVEHIKDAAAIIGQYCDIVAIRCFPSLTNKSEDYNETVLTQFIKYCPVPVISLESATRHPLQSLADLITITENTKPNYRPKVVLTWAPHIKPLPQAVANSFAEWTVAGGVDLTITHPEKYELKESFSDGARIVYDQQEAIKDADFIYVKNWSSYKDYGQMPGNGHADWLLNEDKLQACPNAKIMHCLPVRRNVELTDELLEGHRSLTLQQAANRVFAAQAVIKYILENN